MVPNKGGLEDNDSSLDDLFRTINVNIVCFNVEAEICNGLQALLSFIGSFLFPPTVFHFNVEL